VAGDSAIPAGTRAAVLRSETWTALLCGDSASLTLDLREPCLHYFPNKRCGKRLVDGKVDGPFGGEKLTKLMFKHSDDRSCGEQTAMVRKPGEPHENACFVFECGNAIANCLDCIPRHRGPNDAVHFDEVSAGGSRDRCEVFRKVLGNGFGFFCRAASDSFRGFHAAML